MRLSSFFETLVEIIGWLKIAASPTLLLGGMGWLLYAYYPSTHTLAIAVLLSLVGLILGAIWATQEWKRKGTIWFLSRTMATPELDD